MAVGFIARVFLLSLVGLAAGGCARAARPADQPDVTQVIKQPLTPEQSQQILKDAGESWLYGQGLGDTALTIGGIVLFPPYALWVLGNGIVSLCGYEPIHFSDALPEEGAESWRSGYSAIASGPGRLSAAIAGREFVTDSVANERLKEDLGQTRSAAENQTHGASFGKKE